MLLLNKIKRTNYWLFLFYIQEENHLLNYNQKFLLAANLLWERVNEMSINKQNLLIISGIKLLNYAYLVKQRNHKLLKLFLVKLSSHENLVLYFLQLSSKIYQRIVLVQQVLELLLNFLLKVFKVVFSQDVRNDVFF
jgi:hypothetical protein